MSALGPEFVKTLIKKHRWRIPASLPLHWCKCGAINQLFGAVIFFQSHSIPIN
jgi:hypothetical protein